MLTKNNCLRAFLWLPVFLLISDISRAGSCSIQTTGNITQGCVPLIVSFSADTGTKSVFKYVWSFGNGDSSNKPSPTYAFNTRGTYTVTLKIIYSDGSTCNASYMPIHVYGLPKAAISLPKDIECFSSNSFIFNSASSPSPDNNPITNYTWSFGDGSISSSKSPSHHYDSTGTYTISLTVTDSKGCTDNIQLKNAVNVIPGPTANFVQSGTNSCDSTIIKFINLSDTNGTDIGSFYWDFGDSSKIDSTHWNPTHTYTKTDIFYFARLILKSKVSGCTSSYTSSEPIYVFGTEIRFIHPDTMCWSEADKGVTFTVTPLLNALNWEIDFGDAVSGPNNINSRFPVNPYTGLWTATHNYAGGPGIYCVKLTITVNCGLHVRQIVQNATLYVKGPRAEISYRGGENFFYPATPRSKQIFYIRKRTGDSCQGTDTVNYSSFIKTGKTDTIKIASYCDAKVTSQQYSNNTICGNNYRYLSYLSLNPTSVNQITYPDSVEIFHDWLAGPNHAPPWNAATDSVPTGNVYYPSSYESNILPYVNIKPGDEFPDYYDAAKYGAPLAVHDSNINLCFGPDMVFFTNFSQKFRLYNAIDDTAPSISPEHCSYNPNYPYASDSLLYMWSFNDPDGKQCTTTVANKDYLCNYSNLVTPYHYYKEKQLSSGGCITVDLTVNDPVTGCSDKTSLIIRIHQPDAHWDTTQYCKMNWDMQQYLLPQGGPLRGFKLIGGGNCLNYNFTMDFSENLPTCMGSNVWVETDSAKDERPGCRYLVYNATTKTYKTDTLHTYNFLPLANFFVPPGLPMMDYTTPGCKTIGIVIKNGDCLDTAWYHNYICFPVFSANFNVLSITGQLLASTADSIGQQKNCPVDSSLKPTHIRVVPFDTSMQLVTKFTYNVSRVEMPDTTFGAPMDYYYQVPFWPDSVSLANPYPAFADSVTSVKDTVKIPAPKSLYVLNTMPNPPDTFYPAPFYLFGERYKHVKNSMGISIDSFVADTSHKNEIDFINRHGYLVLNDSDIRSRRISLNCVNTVTDTSYYTNGTKGWRVVKGAIVYLNKPKAPLTFIQTIPILNFDDPTRDNYVFRKGDSVREKHKHDTADFYLPYPGVYNITSFAANLNGCTDTKTYFYVNGHYSTITADSVTCVGTPTSFTAKVRYFQPANCLTGDCLDESDTYWNMPDPIAYRKSIGDSNKNIIPEKALWDFGDGSPLVTSDSSTLTHVYTKPGVYTVSLFTSDSNGCTIATIRRNYIKVEQIEAGFVIDPLKDTLSFCTPVYITYQDTSLLYLTKYSKGKYARYVDWVKKVFPANARHAQPFDSIVLDTIVVDSIIKWKWNPGDGRKSIVRTESSSVVFDYTIPGKYDIFQQVSTNQCTDSLLRKKYLHIVGPTPIFKPLDSVGCIPLSVRLKVSDLKGVSYVWKKGDGSTESYTAKDIKDSILTVTYSKPGTYYIFLTQTDTTYVSFYDTTINCTVTWPDTSNPSLPLYKIVVYPFKPIKVTGDTFVCVGQAANFNVTADTSFKSFQWNLGNDQIATGRNVSTNYDSVGRYIVTVKATNRSGCDTTATLHIRVDKVRANFTIDTSYANSAAFTFYNRSVNAVKYIWNFGNGDSFVKTDSSSVLYSYLKSMPDRNGNNSQGRLDTFTFRICLEAISIFGCTGDTCEYVHVQREEEPYNVITPNGDGVNDVFRLKYINGTYYYLQIFNRWGQKVFESSDKDNVWDGTDMTTHDPCPAGTYFYIWNYQLIGLPRTTHMGTVTVIR